MRCLFNGRCYQR